MSEKERPRLDSALAQKVVDTIAPRIRRNVNIMNAHGVIIASTDALRIGTHHAGGSEVIDENAIVRITRADAIAGTQPGVNVPLTLNDQLCGVVGVTGAPHEVEPLADLIALTVQLLFTQEREHSRSARRETEARDIISALLSGRTAPDAIDRSLVAHGLRGPKQIEMLLRPSAGQGALEHAEVERQRTAWFNLSGALWRIRLAGEPKCEQGPADEERHLAAEPATGAHQLLAQAEALLALLRYPALVPQCRHRGIWNQEIATAIARTPEVGLKHLAALAQPLSAEQAKTLLVVAAGTSMNEAASSLHIHRNTLVQRLERIGNLAGIDTRHEGESLKLKHAIYARVALGQLQIF